MVWTSNYPTSSGSLLSQPIRDNFGFLKTGLDVHASSSANPHSTTLGQAFNAGKVIDGANSEDNSVVIGDGTMYVKIGSYGDDAWWRFFGPANKDWFLSAEDHQLMLQGHQNIKLLCSAGDVWVQGADGKWFKTWNSEGMNIQNLIYLDRHGADGRNAGELYMKAGGAEKPSNLRLQTGQVTGIDHYLWVDSSGSLRIHTSYPTDENVDGQIVGPQTLDQVCIANPVTDQQITVRGGVKTSNEFLVGELYSRDRIQAISGSDCSAARALTYLQIPSPYDYLFPGGEYQYTHPSVVYVPEGWNGYKYWMANTPYPYLDPDYENPCILASNDGLNWQVPSGGINPISGSIGDSNNDTDLFLDKDGKMYVIFGHYEAPTRWLEITSSSDGITWSVSSILFEDNTSQSHSVVLDSDGKYRMWLHDIPSRTIKMRESDNLTSGWSSEIQCYSGSFSILPWHPKVMKVDEQYVMLCMTRDDGLGTLGIYILTSYDGINWLVGANVMPNTTGLWDNNPYRCSGVVKDYGAEKRIALWYSGSDTWAPGGITRIGYTEINLSSIVEKNGNLGIGVGASPAKKLHVGGDTAFNGNVYINYDGPEGDSYLYFYDAGSPTGTYLKWDNAGNKFVLGTGLGWTELWSNAGPLSLNAVTYLHNRTGNNEHVYFDYGGLFYFRDTDAGNIIRASIDSANGNLWASGSISADKGFVRNKYINLPIAGAILPDGTSGNLPASIERQKASGSYGTNPFYMCSNFDDTQEEYLMWSFPMPENYSSIVGATIKFKAAASSGSIQMGVALAAISNDEDLVSKNFNTENSAYTTVPDTIGKIKDLDITLANVDSLAAGDFVILYLKRDATALHDSLVGDCTVVSCILKYST